MCQALHKKSSLALAALLLGLSACADLSIPALDLQLPDAFQQPLPAAPDAPKADLQHWWQSFHDPMLESIITRAQAENLSLQQATQRVIAARALITPAESALYPQVSITGGASFSRLLKGEGIGGGFSSGGSGAASPSASLSGISIDKTTGSYQGGFDSSWELPFFGRGTASVDAAKASLGTAEANAQAARVSLLSEVARTYTELRAAQQKQLILEKMIAAREQNTSLVERKRDSGLSNDSDLAQARTALEQTRALLPTQQQLVVQKLQRLAVLCGQAAPDAEWKTPAPLPAAPVVAFDAVPADLLRARPEIQVAEQTILQRAANAKLAAADLYPQLRLTGSLSANGTFIGQSLGGDTVSLTGGPNISIPLLDWGSRQATLQARKAEWTEASLAYKEAVLQGIEEAENALATADLSRKQAASLKAASVSAEKSLELVDLRYQQGLTDQLDRLTVEGTMLQTQMDSVDAQSAEITGLIALYKSFGGAQLAPVASEQ